MSGHSGLRARTTGREPEPDPKLVTHAVIPGFMLCVLPIGAALAQGDTISAERPGFSSSPIALAPSLLQIEGGYQYTRISGSADAEDHTLPLALLRFGLADRVELQFSWAGISWLDNGGSTSAVNDASIGVKWQLTDDDATVPVALFGGISLPVGDDEVSSEEIEPTLGAFWSYSAAIDWFGTVLLSESGDDVVLSNAVGVALPVDARTGGYVEYFGNYGSTGPEHYLNGGFAYLPRNDMQIDLHVGAGLNGRAADFFLGLGIAYRF